MKWALINVKIDVPTQITRIFMINADKIRIKNLPKHLGDGLKFKVSAAAGKAIEETQPCVICPG